MRSILASPISIIPRPNYTTSVRSAPAPPAVERRISAPLVCWIVGADSLSSPLDSRHHESIARFVTRAAISTPCLLVLCASSSFILRATHGCESRPGLSSSIPSTRHLLDLHTVVLRRPLDTLYLDSQYGLLEYGAQPIHLFHRLDVFHLEHWVYSAPAATSASCEVRDPNAARALLTHSLLPRYEHDSSLLELVKSPVTASMICASSSFLPFTLTNSRQHSSLPRRSP